MRIPVHIQREIARLHFYDPSQSNRSIGRTLSVSSTTVAVLRKAILESGKQWLELQALDDEEWIATLGTRNRSIAQRKPHPDWQTVHEELQKPNATLEQLWLEFRTACPTGIGYTQFSANYQKWIKTRHIAMRQRHCPGEKLFVDFAGATVPVKSRFGEPPIDAQIFVAVLGYSNYTFVCATASQSTSNWIQCHIDCFNALGGVPEWIVPDNLKAAVLGRAKGNIVLNPAYSECLRHYESAPLPARPRKPRDKPKAEVGVQIVQRWVLFALRNRTYFSLEELNADIRERVSFLNAHKFKKLSTSREKLFLEVEQHKLKPLPSFPFDICDWRYGVTVQNDHHVEHMRCFYSVPHFLCNQKVDLRITHKMMEIMHKNRRVALHRLAITEGEVSTLDEHRPISHIRVLEGEPRALMRWAESVGKHAGAMFQHHLQERSDPANGVRAARKMRDLARSFGASRFEEVCEYALTNNMTSLRSIEFILKKSPDKSLQAEVPVKDRPTHENVRGANYYGEQA